MVGGRGARRLDVCLLIEKAQCSPPSLVAGAAPSCLLASMHLRFVWLRLLEMSGALLPEVYIYCVTLVVLNKSKKKIRKRKNKQSAHSHFSLSSKTCNPVSNVHSCGRQSNVAHTFPFNDCASSTWYTNVPSVRCMAVTNRFE